MKKISTDTKNIQEIINKNRRNKRDSLNKGVLFELESCLYLIRKGFTIIFTVEQRKSKQMLQRYRTMKIIDSEKKEVFNRFKHYEVITLNNKKELKINEKGYPIESKEPIIRKRNENGKLIKDRRSERNDVVILHVVYNIMMKLEVDSSDHLIRKGTKISKGSKVSKFRLKEIPVVNNLGITEGFINDENYRIQESQLFHDILTCYFVKNANTFYQNQTDTNIVYTSKYVIIGNLYQILYDELKDEEQKYCEVITKEYLLELMKSNMEIRCLGVVVNENDKGKTND